MLARLDAAAETTGTPIATVTAGAGYPYGKIFGGIENRNVAAVIQTKAELIRSPVPLCRFRFDARHDIVKRPRGKVLRAGKPLKHGRFLHSRSRDCSRCDLKALCISKGRMTKSVVIGDHHPSLLRSCRRRDRRSAEDNCLYQRHRWPSEGYHGEAKTWHGLARAVTRGLRNMRIQALLTAAAVKLKRLVEAALAMWIFMLAAIAYAIDTHIVRRLRSPPPDCQRALQRPLLRWSRDPGPASGLRFVPRTGTRGLIFVGLGVSCNRLPVRGDRGGSAPAGATDGGRTACAVAAPE